jgi:hypothetical protein
VPKNAKIALFSLQTVSITKISYMRNPKMAFLAALLVSLSFYARANDGKVDGVLHGYVMDAVTKKPVSGVTVSAILPGTDNPKEVQTDADGYFSFLELPAAQVTVQFEKKGYQSCKRPGVAIKEKTSQKLNIEFLPEDSDTPSEYPLLRLIQAG